MKKLSKREHESEAADYKVLEQAEFIMRAWAHASDGVSSYRGSDNDPVKVFFIAGPSALVAELMEAAKIG